MAKRMEDSVKVKMQQLQLRLRNGSKQKQRRSMTEKRSTSIIHVIGIRTTYDVSVVRIGVHFSIMHT